MAKLSEQEELTKLDKLIAASIDRAERLDKAIVHMKIALVCTTLSLCIAGWLLWQS